MDAFPLQNVEGKFVKVFFGNTRAPNSSESSNPNSYSGFSKSWSNVETEVLPFKIAPRTSDCNAVAGSESKSHSFSIRIARIRSAWAKVASADHKHIMAVSEGFRPVRILWRSPLADF